MNKEIHRMQQLAGIKSLNELSIRKNYFHEWKLIVLKHLQECCNDGFYCELIEPFKQIKDPYDAIEFLVQNEYLHDNDDDREHNEYFIKYGKFLNN